MSEHQGSLQPNSVRFRKWSKYLILSLPIIISFFQIRILDNDFYFLYSMGKYIVNHGFPYTDVLSMHSNMKIVVQQWLSSIIFYFIYNLLGKFGVIALVYISNICICILTYRYISLVTNNTTIAAVLSAVIDLVLFDPFMVTRPQIFTYVILLLEIILLERHARTKSIKYLFALPVLSLLLINLPAAMWPMLFIFMLPYVAGSIPVHFESYKNDPSGNLLALLAAMAVSIVLGFLNPYGPDNMLYLTTSYGHDSFEIIAEMKAPSLSMMEGKALYALLAVICILAFFIKKRQFSVRFFLLFAGTLLLGMMQIKGIPYFLLFGVPASSYLLKDLNTETLTKPFKKYLTKRVNILLIVFLAVSLGYICESRFFQTLDIKESQDIRFYHLNNIIEILNDSDEPVILYTNFNNGQYLEFNGYHPYIDGRAEVFTVDNNKRYDYFDEYYLIYNSGIYYRDFIDKYQFNYLIINNDIDSYLYLSLIHDDDFEIVYSGSDILLFKSITQDLE